VTAIQRRNTSSHASTFCNRILKGRAPVRAGVRLSLVDAHSGSLAKLQLGRDA